MFQDKNDFDRTTGEKMNIDLQAVKRIIAQGESDTLEFKKSTAQLEAIAETLSAFANHNGGMVIVGVSDSGKMSGQHVSDSTKREIAQMLKRFEPPIHAHSQYLSAGNGNYLIVLEISHDPAKVPVAYQGRAYTRVESTNALMPQSRYRELLVSHKGPTWEELPAVSQDIQLLDHEEIQKTLRQAVAANRITQEALSEPIEKVLSHLELIKNEVLTNAAAVLFLKDTRSDYPQCLIRMARFLGKDETADFLDNQRAYGHAFQLLEDAHVFLRRHLPIASFYPKTGLQRIDRPALPSLAVREALINAICHRDYTNRSTSISLAIFDDRLEIWNIGTLPPQLSIESLKHSHGSYPRNKLIADVFYYRKFIEGWGTGTVKMIKMCQEENLPTPEFLERSGGLCVVFKFREPITSYQNGGKMTP